jgi:hypothetical protein
VEHGTHSGRQEALRRVRAFRIGIGHRRRARRENRRRSRGQAAVGRHDPLNPHRSPVPRVHAAQVFGVSNQSSDFDETRDHQRVRRNEATRLYRANWLKRHPKDDPESLPYIAGAAAVFEERVWSN